MKTKQDLLRAMERMGACGTAIDYVKAHPSSSALVIGLACDRPAWLIWLLEKRLTKASRRLFARRLDVPETGRDSSDDLWVAGMCVRRGDELDRRVIDDCWRAWCRS